MPHAFYFSQAPSNIFHQTAFLSDHLQMDFQINILLGTNVLILYRNYCRKSDIFSS
jgi:hypothetical protein